MSDGPLAAALGDLLASVGEVEGSLEPFLPSEDSGGNMQSTEALREGLSEGDQAKVSLALSMALNSLYMVVLKTRGLPVENDSPVLKDMQTVRDYVLRLRALQSSSAGNAAKDSPSASASDESARAAALHAGGFQQLE